MLDPKQLEGSPRAEVLRFIQRNGSATIKDLEGAMGVTTTAVREQVERLLREGFLQATRVRGEIGRPFYVYALTEKAQDLFPKDYATLAMLLLQETLALYGPEGLRQLLNRVSSRMAEKFADHTQGKELSQKLLGLVAALGDAGMEVSMLPVADKEGDFVLTTHTCPYFEVARNHREICDMEQEMMADLLGPGVGVKLSSCILDGQHSCGFHISRIELEPQTSKERVRVTSVGTPE